MARRSPYFQGDLDGLCGVYAVINASMYVLDREVDQDVSTELFQRLLLTFPRRRYPKLLWDGTSFGDFKRMCKCVEDYFYTDDFNIMFFYPHLAYTPKNISTYWRSFDEWLDTGTRGAAIIGIDEPFMHWSVVYRTDASRIVFFDSSGGAHTKNRSSLSFKPSSSNRRYRLHPRDVVIVHSD